MDGKTHTTIRQVTTAGTQKIEGGKLDFAAKNEQVATVFQDGDDKNFTKSLGAKSNTMITQKAVGGDENSSFKASSTKVSSSSKVVTEHRSTLGETLPLTTSDSVVRKVYTTDIPSDLKNHPSYTEGKTKVTQETRTLPDGTTVTTTRYETKGGTTSQSQTTSKYSATSKSSSEHSSSMKTSQTMQGGSTVVKELRGTDEVDFVCEPRTTMQIVRSSDQNVHQARDRSQKVHQEHHETVEEHRSSSHLIDKQARSELHERHLAEQQLLDKQTDVQKTTSEKVHRTKDVQQKSASEKLHGTHTEQVVVDMVPVDNIEVTRPSEHITHITTATHDTKGTTDFKLSTDVAATTTKSTTYHHDTTRDNKKLTNEQFITTERQHEVDTRKSIEPTQARPEPQKGKQPQYEQPEKRQPIQPPKSEWEQPAKTEGQYDTTYRTDYTNRKISVEVSPTHDAFARSLRAVSPERLPPHLVSPTQSTKTTPSRSSTSPDKCRYPSRGSPERKSRSGSPRKSADRFSSTETITYSSRASPEKKTPTKYVNGFDVIRRRDDDTITRRSKPRSRSASPISTVASEIEYFKNVNELVTDLDEITDESVTSRTERPSSLEITTRKTKKVTERSPTSPLKDVSPAKGSPPRAASPQKTRTLPEDRPMKRTDTYEERCRQILGITETNERRRSSLEKTSIKRSSFSKDSTMSPTEPPRKKSVESPRRTSFERKSPEKSPTKEKPFRPTEFVTQPRKSPEKQVKMKSPSPTKEVSRSPEKQTTISYPEQKRPPTESSTKLQEFPSQIRRSPEKQLIESYPEKRSPSKDSPSKISKFPSQIRKSPERQPLEPYSEKNRPCEKSPSDLNEFPSQIRRSPESQPLEPYPERKSPTKDMPSKLSEFPSQIRKSPVREPLEQYPEKKKPCEDSPSKLKEFPSQIRKAPENNRWKNILRRKTLQPLEKYPEKKKPCEDSPSKLTQFPSQIRRSPERTQSRPSPERHSPSRDVPCSLASIPSPTRKSPEASKPVKKGKKPKAKKPSGTSSSSSSSEDEVVEEVIERVLPQRFVEDGGEDVCETKNKEFIDKERHTTTLQDTHRSTLKKNIDQVKDTKKDIITKTPKEAPKTPFKKQPESHRTEKTKFIGVTEYTDEYCKTRPKTQKTTEKITLMDLERSNKNQVDNKKVVDITKISPSKPEQTTVKKHAVSSISVTTKPKITKTTKTTTKGKVSKPAKLQNGHISSDTDEDIDSIEGSIVSLTVDRTKSDTLKSSITKEHVTRVAKTKDDLDTIRTSRKPDKCITTKTLIINNKDDKREVIVDLQRSKSSREPTPDRLCPVPLSSDDESGVPRYPDEVEEPDDGSLRRKPKPTRLSDVPIIESEDIAEFTRLTEVKDTKKITQVDRVDQTDESLLSVNKKIHKFLDTAEKLTKEPLKVSGPVPKVERPKMEVVEDLKSDDCLLSVSDKVSKFISTAEQLITPSSIPERPKSPRCQNYPYEPTSKPKPSSDTTIEIEETIKDDDCLLSVSEKVSKFISTADKLATSDAKKPTVSLAKIDIKSRQEPSRRSPERKVPDRKSPERKSPSRSTDTECVQIETEEQMYTRRSSPTRSTPSPDEKTPPRRPSNQYKEILKTGMSSTRRSSSPKLPDSTPKSAKDEPKPVLSPTGRLRSTESIKRAKALFENIVTREETCSRFERRSKSPEKYRHRSTSPQKEQPSSKEPEVGQSPDHGDVPHYMLPLDRSLRPNSPHRESLGQSHPEKPIEEPEPHTTKFNKHSGKLHRETEELEKRFHLQTSRTESVRKSSPERRTVDYTKSYQHTSLTDEKDHTQKSQSEYHSSYSYHTERRTSSEFTRKVTSRSQSPEVKPVRAPSPQKQTPSSRRSPEKEPKSQVSPDRRSKTETKTFTQLKKSAPTSKLVEDDKPEWVKSRNLRKTSETSAPLVRKTTTTTTTKSTKKETVKSSSPVKEVKTTDLITSSYGVGPTDENGTPLFGLRALRAQNKNDVTKGCSRDSGNERILFRKWRRAGWPDKRNEIFERSEGFEH
nr:unnamed protein product [Callosobruchus analis]